MIKERLEKWRWKKLKNGYIFDKLLINIFAYTIFAYLIVVMASYGFDFSYNPYFECKNDKLYCVNPFYIPVDSAAPQFNEHIIMDMKYKEKCLEEWCYEQRLSPGKYGSEPNNLFRYAQAVAWSLFLTAFIISLVILAIFCFLLSVDSN